MSNGRNQRHACQKLREQVPQLAASVMRSIANSNASVRDEWISPMCQATPATAEADAMHALLVLRADELEGCTENSTPLRK